MEQNTLWSQLATVQDVMVIWLSETYSSTTQMGSACVYKLDNADGPRVRVQAALALRADLCSRGARALQRALLMRSCPSSDLATSKMLSNVVLQRILSSVVIPREVIAQAEHMMRALLSAGARDI